MQYYLSVQESDLVAAKQVQAEVVETIPAGHPTDQLLTNSARKRAFPGRQGCQPKKEALDSQGLV
jgi:hypothetical protein